MIHLTDDAEKVLAPDEPVVSLPVLIAALAAQDKLVRGLALDAVK